MVVNLSGLRGPATITTTWVKFCLKTTMVVMVTITLQNLEKRSNCTLKFEWKTTIYDNVGQIISENDHARF